MLGQPVSDGFSRTYCGNGSMTACRTRCARRSRTRSRCPGPRSTTRTRARRRAAGGQLPGRQERPVVLGLRPLPPDRRRHRPHDPLDQPPDLPAGDRDPGSPPAGLRPAQGRDAVPGAARAGLQGMRGAQPPARPAARVRVLQPARAALRLPHHRRARRERQARELHRARELLGVRRQPVDAGGRGRRERDVQPHRRAQASDLSDYTGELQVDSTCGSPTATTRRPPGGGSDPAHGDRLPAGRTRGLRRDAGHHDRRRLLGRRRSTRSCRARSRRATARSGSSAPCRCSTAARTACSRPRRTRCSPARASSSRNDAALSP